MSSKIQSHLCLHYSPPFSKDLQLLPLYFLKLFSTSGCLHILEVWIDSRCIFGDEFKDMRKGVGFKDNPLLTFLKLFIWLSMWLTPSHPFVSQPALNPTELNPIVTLNISHHAVSLPSGLVNPNIGANTDWVKGLLRCRTVEPWVTAVAGYEGKRHKQGAVTSKWDYTCYTTAYSSEFWFWIPTCPK